MNTKVLETSMLRALDGARADLAVYQQVPIPLCELSRLVGIATGIQMACEYDGLSATRPLYTVWKQAKELHAAFRDVLTQEYARHMESQDQLIQDAVEMCNEAWRQRLTCEFINVEQSSSTGQEISEQGEQGESQSSIEEVDGRVSGNPYEYGCDRGDGNAEGNIVCPAREVDDPVGGTDDNALREEVAADLGTCTSVGDGVVSGDANV